MVKYQFLSSREAFKVGSTEKISHCEFENDILIGTPLNNNKNENSRNLSKYSIERNLEVNGFNMQMNCGPHTYYKLLILPCAQSIMNALSFG